MTEYKFVFDLDSTLTKAEILPEIAKELGMYQEMRNLTEQAMCGRISFEQSFTQRVRLLQTVPVSRVRDLVAKIPLHEKLLKFISLHKERCFIATGNLNIWLPELLCKIDMQTHCFCSQAETDQNGVITITSLLDKIQVVKRLGSNVVAVGDGDNDAGMISAATIGIGFGAVRPIAPSVRKAAAYNIDSEAELCTFLYSLAQK